MTVRPACRATSVRSSVSPATRVGVSGTTVNGLLEVSTGDLNEEGTIVLSFYPDPTGIVTVDPTTPEQGGSATFTYVADTFTYQWFLDGEEIADEESSELTLTDADYTNNGSYTLSVTNDRTSKTKIFGPLIVEIEEPSIPSFPSLSDVLHRIDAYAPSSLLTSLSPDTPAANGQSLIRVLDQSGNSKHYNQSTEGERPIYIASNDDGSPAIRFSSSILNFNLPDAGTDVVTAFIVMKSTSTQYTLISEADGTTGGYPLRAQQSSTNTFIRANSGSPAYYVDGVLQSWANRGEAWTALDGLHFVAITNWFLHATWTRGDDQAAFGGYANGSEPWATDLLEFVLLAGDKAADVGTFRTYAQSKWGTP